MADCIFCAILAGAAPAHRVAEEADAVAFLDIFPVAPGHTLVIPRRHAANIFEIDAESMAAVASLVRRVAGAVGEELAPDGIGVYQANGQAAGQTIWHYHVHVIPCRTGEGLVLHGRERADDRDLAATAARLAARVPPPDSDRGRS